jgi:hypothetical protein
LVVGVSHHTPAFAAHAIAPWWHQEGSTRYRGSPQLIAHSGRYRRQQPLPMLRLENRASVAAGQLLCSGRNPGSLSHWRFQVESYRASPLLRSFAQLGRRTTGFFAENPPLCPHHLHPNGTASQGRSGSPPVSLRGQAHIRSNLCPSTTAPRHSARVELHYQASTVKLFFRDP